jgi:hypothetical protein
MGTRICLSQLQLSKNSGAPHLVRHGGWDVGKHDPKPTVSTQHETGLERARLLRFTTPPFAPDNGRRLTPNPLRRSQSGLGVRFEPKNSS